MVSFEMFVKAMPPSLSELKVLPSFCFAFKIPEDVAASNMHGLNSFNATFGKCICDLPKYFLNIRTISTYFTLFLFFSFLCCHAGFR